MNQLNKFRVQYQQGKEIKREQIGDPRVYMDSIAESVLLKTQEDLHNAKNPTKNNFVKILSFDIYEEVELPKAHSKEAKDIDVKDVVNVSDVDFTPKKSTGNKSKK